MVRYTLFAVLLVFACTSTKSGTMGTVVPPPGSETSAPVDSFPAVPKRMPPMPPPVLPEPAEIIPAPAPTQVQNGFWVQVFASHTGEGAEVEAQRARARQTDPVTIQFIGNLWKVRIGSFPDRQTAEMVRSRVQQLGWIDSWIVAPQSDMFAAPSYSLPSSEPPSDASGIFAVQVAASQYQEEGRQIMNNLLSLGFNKVYLSNEDDLWKVRVGTFPSRGESDEIKEQLRNIGFIDAYVVMENR